MVAQPLNIGGAAAAQNQYNISNIFSPCTAKLSMQNYDLMFIIFF